MNLNTGKHLFEAVKNASSPPLSFNNNLVFGAKDNDILFMNSQTGKIETLLNLEEQISTRPVELGGLIAAGTSNGNLIIINPEGIK